MSDSPDQHSANVLWPVILGCFQRLWLSAYVTRYLLKTVMFSKLENLPRKQNISNPRMYLVFSTT